MQRRNVVFGLALLPLAACGGRRATGPDGLPVQTVYDITPEVAQQIPYRMLDGVNALRTAAGVPALTLDAQLVAAAETHSIDMARQNRPWHFGSNGSSPIDRLRQVGFGGQLVGETIAESYDTELQTLAAWMDQADTRDVVMDPAARRMGVAWYQEPAGKIWWTMVLTA